MNTDNRHAWVIAVDGGGSKIAVVAQQLSAGLDTPVDVPDSLEGARTWSFAGTGSAHPSSWGSAQQQLSRALSMVVSELGHGEQALQHVLFALAGAGRAEDQARVCDWASRLQALKRCASVACVGDIEPLVDYCGQRPDRASIALILGTGSIVAARSAEGKIVRAGGWGPNLGDECSGGALGLAALRNVVDWYDADIDVLQASAAVRRVIDRLAQRFPDLLTEGAGDRSALARALIETAADRTATARMADILLESAFEDGNRQDRELLDWHVSRVVAQVEHVLIRGFDRTATFDIVMCGGLAAHFPKLQQALLASCQARGLSASGCIAADPLLAALRYALRQAATSR